MRVFMTFVSDIYIYEWEQKPGGETVMVSKLTVNMQVQITPRRMAANYWKEVGQC